MNTLCRWFTPAQVAAIIGAAKVDLVYSHIKSGRLAAVNIGTGDARPCWRITQAAIDAFMAARTSAPAPQPAARQRTRRPAVTRYF